MEILACQNVLLYFSPRGQAASLLLHYCQLQSAGNIWTVAIKEKHSVRDDLDQST